MGHIDLYVLSRDDAATTSRGAVLHLPHFTSNLEKRKGRETASGGNTKPFDSKSGSVVSPSRAASRPPGVRDCLPRCAHQLADVSRP